MKPALSTDDVINPPWDPRDPAGRLFVLMGACEGCSGGKVRVWRSAELVRSSRERFKETVLATAKRKKKGRRRERRGKGNHKVQKLKSNKNV